MFSYVNCYSVTAISGFCSINELKCQRTTQAQRTETSSTCSGHRSSHPQNRCHTFSHSGTADRAETERPAVFSQTPPENNMTVRLVRTCGNWRKMILLEIESIPVMSHKHLL